MSASPPTVSEMVEALCLYDEPMLNSRYNALLLRRAGDGALSELASLPRLVLESARHARTGALTWEMREGARVDEFIEWAEHTLLAAFLQLSESQLGIAAHMARLAPDAAVRRPFDSMCATHRYITSTLRKALDSTAPPLVDGHAYRRCVQEEEPTGDFRGQLAAALAAAEAAQAGVRRIVLSPVGLRHLRDQGLFRAGQTTIHGHQVAVDFGWDAPAFAIETNDCAPLEEVMLDDGPAARSLPPRAS